MDALSEEELRTSYLKLKKALTLVINAFFIDISLVYFNFFLTATSWKPSTMSPSWMSL